MSIDRAPSRSALKAIRFGYGLPGPSERLGLLALPDRTTVSELARRFRRIRQSNADTPADRQARRDTRIELLRTIGGQARLAVARAVSAENDYEERLVQFWADHFTLSFSQLESLTFTHFFIEEAIRPHISGYFSDMLKASTKHPAMLFYLDQTTSMGPNSFIAKRRPGRGLNENLAREVLELHSLGVGGGYSQADVTELAKLFTGLSARRSDLAFEFRPALEEPGAETVLGRRYGGGAGASVKDIDAVLDDLSVHPETARHIARKLAVHFVSDTPSDELVADLAALYRLKDGYLPDLYRALAAHPEARRHFGAKAKPPFDFVVSGLRALGVTGSDVLQMDLRLMRRAITEPMDRMGQPWRRPPGPDGWPEEFSAWITPQGVAERVNWALNAPKLFGLTEVDPLEVATRALGELASDNLIWAAPKAETRAQGVALVLASPEFNRR
ncbi:MAG: DUF1800 domain-containing protein [Pseudomonadota bacterium]